MTGKSETDAPGGQGGFEPNLVRLREAVERLERGDLTLEEGVALYKEGLAAARACRASLDNARYEVSVLQDGLLKDFEPQAGPRADAEEDDGGAR